MNTPKASPVISEPEELSEAVSGFTGKALSKKQISDLASELDIKEQFIKTTDGKELVGDYPYFEECMDTDPTGALAREQFAWEKVYVDLGASADRIIINRKQYFQGHWYNIRKHQLSSFNDMMYQTHRHEQEVFDREGTKNWMNKRQKHAVIRGKGVSA